MDECVNVKLRPLIVNHETTTVRYMGWLGKRDKSLLDHAAAEGCACIITLDRGLLRQINLSTLPIAVILLRSPRNRIDILRHF